MEAVEAANNQFYAAFEAGDLDALSDVWEHSDRVICTHPGWATLRGWAKVSSSFYALFQGSQHLQFILTQQQAVLMGDTAWVSVDENILDTDAASTVAAINLFVRHADGRWRMVAHHASPVTASAEVGQEDDED